ncbi:MAG: hypothetical protein E7029_07230 [Planctomycetaceae bacterium]|nr:hypothetical protein [Planctomycetaceae bacterium]
MTNSKALQNIVNSNSLLRPAESLGFIGSSFRFGAVQKAGHLSVLPILGRDCEGKWISPYSGLKFTGVHGYGCVSFHNDTDGTAILPMHMGYIQEGAQNHAISAAALLGSGQERRYENARCVQAAQGGYLKTAEQWFFILPLKLRQEMLERRAQIGCGKMWDAIGRLGRRFGSNGRGHLDDTICKHRAELNEYGKQFELLPEQVGAMFFLDKRLVGIEIGPTAEWFADIWNSLICFCYGTAAWELEKVSQTQNESVSRCASLEEVREKLLARRTDRTQTLLADIESCDWEVKENEVEENLLDLQLSTLKTGDFFGQTIRRDDQQLVYASMFRLGLGV